MLSKTRKSSPIRIAGGAIGVSALTLAALGLTASGTQAAERISAGVETVTGIALLGQDAPPPLQDAPPPPKPPKAGTAPTPPAPPAAPGEHKGERRVVVVRHGDGDEHGKHGQRVMIVNGERVEIPGQGDIAMMIPDVKSGNCKDGDPRDMVVQTPPSPGKRGRIVICTNRIEMSAGDAQRMAERHRGMGKQHALIGLRHARAAIEADTTLTPEQKSHALKGIDDAIREIQNSDKD